jgi:hypothetical protein
VGLVFDASSLIILNELVDLIREDEYLEARRTLEAG